MAARHLANLGVRVSVATTRPREDMAAVPAHQLDIVERMGITVGETDPTAELAVDENTVIYVASMVEAMGHSVPKDSGKRQGLICVYVPDCDAAYEQAKAAGATCGCL